jgi:hypothetical protein
VPGRTPAAAFQSFAQPLADALSCIAACKLTPSAGGMNNPKQEHQLLANSGQAIELGGPKKLSLRVLMRYRFVEKDDLEDGPWKVQTLSYSYTVLSHDAEMVNYHWHPGGKSHEAAPHLHLGSTQLHAGSILSHKHHLPTSRVSLEQVIRLLISEQGVEPRHSDWDARLTLTDGMFQLYRTWSDAPPAVPK